jgi:two-component SAPR family response regulator
MNHYDQPIDHRRPVADACRRPRLTLDTLPDPCTAAQLAEALDKSPKTIVDWCQEREYTLIPCFRLGNRWYHRLPELVRWLNGVKSGRIEFRRKPRISRKRR